MNQKKERRKQFRDVQRLKLKGLCRHCLFCKWNEVKIAGKYQKDYYCSARINMLLPICNRYIPDSVTSKREAICMMRGRKFSTLDLTGGDNL